MDVGGTIDMELSLSTPVLHAYLAVLTQAQFVGFCCFVPSLGLSRMLLCFAISLLLLLRVCCQTLLNSDINGQSGQLEWSTRLATQDCFLPSPFVCCGLLSVRCLVAFLRFLFVCPSNFFLCSSSSFSPPNVVVVVGGGGGGGGGVVFSSPFFLLHSFF